MEGRRRAELFEEIMIKIKVDVKSHFSIVEKFQTEILRPGRMKNRIFLIMVTWGAQLQAIFVVFTALKWALLGTQVKFWYRSGGEEYSARFKKRIFFTCN